MILKMTTAALIISAALLGCDAKNSSVTLDTNSATSNTAITGVNTVVSTPETTETTEVTETTTTNTGNTNTNTTAGCNCKCPETASGTLSNTTLETTQVNDPKSSNGTSNTNSSN